MAQLRNRSGGMVLLGRIELPTSALPRMRSTTELQQHTIPLVSPGHPLLVEAGGRGGQGRAIGRGPLLCQATGSIAARTCQCLKNRPEPPNRPAKSALPRRCVKTSSAARRKRGNKARLRRFPNQKRQVRAEAVLVSARRRYCSFGDKSAQTDPRPPRPEPVEPGKPFYRVVGR